ncbi:response regulator transcription factor [Helicobacter canadensis]|uniref:Response regulator n=1 Tax=Helicobacter canadensis MIT 98-5491 TaxID=537970 RepID=C5ZYE0_9HELI|nr:response regulator transcription factor [Helicobacter canadensis]EES90158.1 response regulator [Helicobacter canadensis MIT 98-5491]EFR49314.1 putative transcriptional regulatory protein OmpR [Helicobacter canadensis MIT 98-5491]STP02336.1 response regulator [Helicobacter canadensis]
MLEILMIEDDLELATILSEYLKAHNINATNYDEPYTGMSAINTRHFDLLLLDLTLPNLDGLEVCKKVAKEKRIPIIISSARHDVDDRVLGLEYGADDYIPKPYDPKELVARIHSVLRRYKTIEKPDSTEIICPPFRLNKSSREIFLNNTPLDLTKAEYEILSFMIENKNQALTRDSIAAHSDSISPDSTNKSIDVIIGRLRSKIEKEGKKYIFSIRGIGYKFQTKDNE